MPNILTTIPQSKFAAWPECEAALKRATGESKWHFWLINTPRMPAKLILDHVCFIIHSGQVRGYLHIIEIAPCRSWDHHNDAITRGRKGFSIVMANFRPVANGEEAKGFQGWRYTQMQP